MGEFDVGIKALRDDVGIWDEQSGRMKQIADDADGLRMDRLEAGIFQIFLTAYREAVGQVVGRATEGSAAMAAVGTTLANVATAYQQDESGNTHKFTDLH